MRRIVWSDHRRKRPIPEYAEIYSDLNDKLDAARNRLVRARPEKVVQYTQELSTYMSLKEQSETCELELLCDAVTQRIVTGDWDTRLQFHINSDQRLITEFKCADPINKYLDRYIALLLRRFFQVHIPSRDQCIRTSRDYFHSLTPPSRQFLIRTDISQFFSSISHEYIKMKLRKHLGVPTFVIEYVDALLASYEKAVGTEGYGIPAGIPISATLAEITLENLDLWAREHSRIGLYVRYVDDILISSDRQSGDEIMRQVQRQLKDAGLKLSSDTERHTQIRHPNDQPTEFDFLGYSFHFSDGKTKMDRLDLSGSKADQYEAALGRIKLRALSGDTCWASAYEVELFTRQVEVLMLPHEYVSTMSYSRVVSGLAYSARFVEKGNGTRFSQLVGGSRALVQEVQGKLLADLGATHPALCKHCQQPAQSRRAVDALVENLRSAERVLAAQPIPVSDVPRYREIKELVWSS